jgi:hypothetical protein
MPANSGKSSLSDTDSHGTTARKPMNTPSPPVSGTSP